MYYHGVNWFLAGKTQGVVGITVVYSLHKHSPTQLQLIFFLVLNSTLGEAFPFKSLNPSFFHFSPRVIMKIGWKYWSREDDLGKVGEHPEGTGAPAEQQSSLLGVQGPPRPQAAHSQQSAWGKCFIVIIYFIINKFPERKTKDTCVVTTLQGLLTELPDSGELSAADQTETILSYFQSPQKPTHSPSLCPILVTMNSFLSRPLAST